MQQSNIGKQNASKLLKNDVAPWFDKLTMRFKPLKSPDLILNFETAAFGEVCRGGGRGGEAVSSSDHKVRSSAWVLRRTSIKPEQSPGPQTEPV